MVDRIILDNSGCDPHLQLRAAIFALGQGRPHDGLMIVTVNGDQNFAVKWNKGSVRVYPPGAPQRSPVIGGEHG